MTFHAVYFSQLLLPCKNRNFRRSVNRNGCCLQVASQDEPLTAQAGDTLLSRSSSGKLLFHSSATVTPNSEQRPEPNCSQLSHAQQPNQDESSLHSAEGISSEQPQSCMDAELQWDAAVLTVMVEGHADADANEGGDACYRPPCSLFLCVCVCVCVHACARVCL